MINIIVSAIEKITRRTVNSYDVPLSRLGINASFGLQVLKKIINDAKLNVNVDSVFINMTINDIVKLAGCNSVDTVHKRSLSSSSFPDKISGTNYKICIGVDIQSASTIRDIYTNLNGAPVNRVFTGSELAHASLSTDRWETLAGIYAAKEAVIKALSSVHLFRIEDVNIHYLDFRPACKFNNSIYNPINLDISISHCSGFAIAACIANV